MAWPCAPQQHHRQSVPRAVRSHWPPAPPSRDRSAGERQGCSAGGGWWRRVHGSAPGRQPRWGCCRHRSRWPATPGGRPAGPVWPTRSSCRPHPCPPPLCEEKSPAGVRRGPLTDMVVALEVGGQIAVALPEGSGPGVQPLDALLAEPVGAAGRAGAGVLPPGQDHALLLHGPEGVVEATGVDVMYAEAGALVEGVVAVNGLLAGGQQETGPEEGSRIARLGQRGCCSLHRLSSPEEVMLL